MMPEGDRLRRLQMGKPRHHAGRMGERLFGKCKLQAMQLLVERVDGAANPEAEIERDLIVARARRMKPPRRGSD